MSLNAREVPRLRGGKKVRIDYEIEAFHVFTILVDDEVKLAASVLRRWHGGLQVLTCEGCRAIPRVRI